MREPPARTILLFTTLGAFAVAAAIGITAVLAWNTGPAEERLLTTAVLLGVFSLSSLLCLAVHARGRVPRIMIAGVAASVVALAIWLILVWGPVLFGTSGDRLMERTMKPGVTASVFAAWATLLGLLMLPRLDGELARGLRWATVGVAGLLAAGIAICYWLEWADDDIGRLLAVLAILAACGTLITPGLAFIETLRRRARPEAIDARVAVELTCPRCGTVQSLRAGPRRCTKCGLKIALQVDEPRCACGYLLYHLEGDECPECGRTVSAEERWVT